MDYKVPKEDYEVVNLKGAMMILKPWFFTASFKSFNFHKLQYGSK